MGTPASSPPTPEDVEAIGRESDPVLRNLRITQAYHELALAVSRVTGPGANWCTFATWASRQAGQTIRREDLARAIEADLGGDPEIGELVARASELVRAAGREADHARIVAAIRDVLSPVRAAERASEAVARGNKKVFDEIGREFARFAAIAGDAPIAATSLERFCGDLEPGPPPDGQDLLGLAFTGYVKAVAAADPQQRAEQLLLANLRIGLHEQTRLQPEIVSALEAPVEGARELRTRLVERLLPEPGTTVTRRGLPGVMRALDDDVARVAERVRHRIRAVITDRLMTLDLPSGTVRLGRDVAGPCPEALRTPVDAALRELLARVDPGPASGAEDWGDLGQRMHFIAELFRLRQEDTSLFDAPFDPVQTDALRQGRLPAGRL